MKYRFEDPVVYKDLEQGTPEWLQMRSGLLTASRVRELFTKGLAPSYARMPQTLGWHLLGQRITGYVEPQHESDAMLRGHEEEDIARTAYVDRYEAIERVGFVTRRFTDPEDGTVTVLGYSPDGLVADDGLIEIKSKCQKLQVETIINNRVPDEFWLQIQTGMLVTGRRWCDFISVCGGMPMFVMRADQDHAMQDAILARGFELERWMLEAQKAYDEHSKGFTVTERIVDQGDELVWT